ncbi:MAG: hypothetical protein QF475_01170 [Candidatus Undinarchaeales archaeon]|jgi:hypothetical protein|nr:hypothetical protein [Candidatus Undinarchaeales archaeon]
MKQKLETKKVVLALVGLILLSFLGTAAYFSSVGKLQFSFSPTGFASEGFVSADIAGTTAIDVVDTQINLSTTIDTAGDASAYVATNATSATINSFDNVSNENWLNRTGAEARLVEKDNLTVNNTGSTIANITLSSNSTPTTFFGVGGGNFWVKITNGTDNAAGAGCTQIQKGSWVEYSTNTTNLCGMLPTFDLNDTIDLWIQWQVPAAAIARVYNSTLTISATQAS